VSSFPCRADELVRIALVTDEIAASDETKAVAEPESVAGAEPETSPVKFTVLTLEVVDFELSDPSPMLWLVEADPPYRRLPIPIAVAEAQSLARHLGQVPSARPTTHDLFSGLLRAAQCDIVACRITDFVAGVYYAELVVATPKGRSTLDCRPSDGINLALRQRPPAPILCDDGILTENSTRRR
jgi:bifunctional DNase/RNase